MYEQDIEQHNSQLSYQKLKTMVKRCLDQRIRAEVSRPEMKEPRQEHQRNTEAKENLSALKGSKENAVKGKRRDSAPRGNAFSFRHDENRRGQAMQSSSLLQDHRLKVTRFFFERKSSQRS